MSIRISGLMANVETLHASLDYHLARHNLLTANLTQVDTPGYKPLDLERPAPTTNGSFSQAMSVAMEATDPNHFGGGGAGAASDFRVMVDANAPVGLDGNAVSVDREAVKIAANHVRYETIASLTSSELGSLAWAANDGRTL